MRYPDNMETEEALTFKQRFGARLRQLRKDKGLTQAELAELLRDPDSGAGPDVPQISRWEHGKTFPDEWNRRWLADALGVPEERLFYDPQDVNNQPG